MSNVNIALVQFTRSKSGDGMTNDVAPDSAVVYETTTITSAAGSTAFGVTCEQREGPTQVVGAAAGPQNVQFVFWRIANMGTDDIAVKFGVGAQTATINDFGIPAGTVAFFGVTTDDETGAVINVP